MKKRILALLLLSIVLLGLGCENKNEITVYTSVDQVYSEPVFKAFQDKTNIKVKAVYDIEASKTVGLANRLIEERDRPVADVFWNGEVSQTMRLIDLEIVEKDSFVEFGGRGRVILYDRTKIDLKDLPKTVEDLGSEKYGKDGIRWAMAYPMFGTSSTQAAALYSLWGSEEAYAYYQKLKDNGVVLVDGNSVVKDFVSSGKVVFGLTDTDDAQEAMNKNTNLDILFLDQETIGALVIPNTVTIVKGSGHQDQAKAFIDYLQSQEAQEMMYESGWLDENISQINILKIDWLDLYYQLQRSKEEMTSLFIR
ncbi:MAG: extracellular solute-binding protein [Bacillota bacterium]|nr:extracellular solute-binding protein [Bacillota bacterium]